MLKKRREKVDLPVIMEEDLTPEKRGARPSIYNQIESSSGAFAACAKGEQGFNTIRNYQTNTTEVAHVRV